MLYNKGDLVYSDYKWNVKLANDDPDFRHYQEASELNRSEGNEMLYFINALAKEWKWTTDPPCQKLEKTIRTKVPESTRTHRGIKSWIENNFKTFWETI